MIMCAVHLSSAPCEDVQASTDTLKTDWNISLPNEIDVDNNQITEFQNYLQEVS